MLFYDNFVILPSTFSFYFSFFGYVGSIRSLVFTEINQSKYITLHVMEGGGAVYT